MATLDQRFDASIPAVYERELVPLIFQPYAEDLARRVLRSQPSRVLELAAGTGAVTRVLATRLPASSTLVASDLNAPMVEQAKSRGTARAVDWRVADAMSLPFDDGAFDAVVCQFGAMFFPDKARAFAEARRVLAPGGRFLFSVWDRIEDNGFAEAVTLELARVFPADPPRFMARAPHGYCDAAAIRAHLAAAGFASTPSIDVVTFSSRATGPRSVAVAFCQGTPLRNEIDARDATALAAATDAVAEGLTRRYGPGPVEARMQALVVEVPR
ncbi:methyltransferase domain-containing protein [Aggregicoccus sp. 17bor-14]|uniref:class I SAM-dependent methyltransferase n=1 Tax=Myxococcaceae TaxID=31 RepID=UPI00129CDD18|nr:MULTISPECIES: class I SAM-dependent methyltransferase [Myxococcaceae]MBF5045808.1 methyltransferase domain-containing protein [Simulacricoccus sp. 17bor-14]MRI91543.1 methyltransferase domain-containing protein [Aggregicoccus sp. 17bor-14]